MNIGQRIDQLVKIREKRRTLSKEMDELTRVYDEAAGELREIMEGQGLDKSTGKLGTVSLKDTVVGHVNDWDKVYNYILRNKAFHLMQRRLSEPAFREIVELRKGKNIPGIEPFTKKGINLRNLNNS